MLVEMLSRMSPVQAELADVRLTKAAALAQGYLDAQATIAAQAKRVAELETVLGSKFVCVKCGHENKVNVDTIITTKCV